MAGSSGSRVDPARSGGRNASAGYAAGITWSVSGGYSGTIGVRAESEPPCSGEVIFNANNNGQTDGGTFSTADGKVARDYGQGQVSGISPHTSQGGSPLLNTYPTKAMMSADVIVPEQLTSPAPTHGRGSSPPLKT
jgi:hypothetical protein